MLNEEIKDCKVKGRKGNKDEGLLVYSKLLYYDETSKSCVRWREDVVWGRSAHKTQVLFEKDSEAGYSSTKDRFYLTTNKYGTLAVSRIIYTMFHPDFDKSLFIDHIDGNPLNNKIENLRAVPTEINARNRRSNPVNTSGHPNVQFCRKTWPSGKNFTDYWVVRWRNEDNKECSKNFSCKKYGEDVAKQMAIEYREMLFKELVISLGYTERHGRG